MAGQEDMIIYPPPPLQKNPKNIAPVVVLQVYVQTQGSPCSIIL